jgi:hypothetical protein
MFTGITAGMYENGLGHIEPVFDNHPSPHPDPTPPSDPIESDTGPSIDVIQWSDPNSPVGNSSSGPNTQFSTDCDSFWMPPEGPDALPNVPGFSDCGWPLNGQFVIGNTTYSVEGWALTQSAGGAAYSQTFFAWSSVLNPNPPTINSMTVLNMDHFMAHGSWAMNMQNN